MKKRIISLLLLLSLLFTGSAGCPDVSAMSESPDILTASESFVYDLKAEDIKIRDSYIVVYEGKYYMYGTDGTNAFGGQMDNFPVWVSEDLENWDGPFIVYENDGTFWADKQYWAPEVYYIDNEFYLYGSMGGSARKNKGIQLFKADNPLGPFEPTTDYPFTPEEDDDIDATLYEENNLMYMVYSQGSDGIYAVKLNDTLDGFADTPFKLFNVADCSWPVAAFGGMILNDGPCFYMTSSGKLLCLFSSMSEDGYNMGIAYSDNGRLDGNWTVTDNRLDVGSDGGHCMIFENLNGETMICYHAPNEDSHPRFQYLIEDTENDTVYVSDKSPVTVTPVENIFKDVSTNSWFTDSVQFVYDRGIMRGLSQTQFGPLTSLARAQFAVMLYRMQNEPHITYEPRFSDISDGMWYTNAILWSARANIMTGYTNSTLYGYADNITREQVAVVLYRYAAYLGYDTTKSKDLSTFTDESFISNYAEKAMSWAFASKIITGKDNGTRLDPAGYASRAECAAMLQRFINLYEN